MFTVLPHFISGYRQMQPDVARKALSFPFHSLLYRARQRQGLRVFALGQRLRRIAKHTAAMIGVANGARVWHWMQEQKTGWCVVFLEPRMPVTSALLDHAHNVINRKLFMMRGFHHPNGSQQAFFRGLAQLYNLVPYQRRTQHAGQCDVEVEVEGGNLPIRDWRDHLVKK